MTTPPTTTDQPMTRDELAYAYEKAHNRYWEARNLRVDYEYLQGVRTGLYAALHPTDEGGAGQALLVDYVPPAPTATPAADFTLCYCDDATHPSAERESKWRDLKAVAKDQEFYSPQAHIVRRVITLATVTP